jgi:hypothetical protein
VDAWGTLERYGLPMKASNVALVLVALLSALSGCGGSLAGNSGPGVPTPVAARGSANASFVIHVPRVKHHRHARFISPSSQAAAIAVTPASGCVSCSDPSLLSVDLSQSSPDCTNATAGLTCTVSEVLAPGSYLLGVATYDGPVKNGFPTGTMLGVTNGIAATIVPGKANVPQITLDGIPTSLVTFNLGQKLVISNGVFEMVGQSSHAFFQIYARDADGNVIVGPGSPTFTVTPDAASGFTASVNANTVALNASNHVFRGFYTMAVTAVSPACAQAGATCSFQDSVGYDPIAATADPTSNSIVLVAAGTNELYATITAGIDNPSDVRFDPSGNLFVANKNANDVTVYAPPYTAGPFKTISSGINGPSSIALSADGSYMAVANSGSGTTTVYAPPTNTTITATILQPTLSLAFDATGGLWIGDAVPGIGVLRYAPPSFSGAPLEVTNGVHSPTSIAFDLTGSLYVANQSANTITKYTSPYSGVPISATGLNGVTSLTELGFDELVACYDGGAAFYGGSLTSSVTLNTNATPCRAAVDQNLATWLTYANSGVIQAFAFPWTQSSILQQYKGALTNPVAISVYP